MPHALLLNTLGNSWPAADNNDNDADKGNLHTKFGFFYAFRFAVRSIYSSDRRTDRQTDHQNP